MGIFNKKKEYIVVTNMATNGVVREFAKEHCAEGCEIDVHVHGCLLEGDNLVTITFKSDMEEAVVYSDLIDRFMDPKKTEGEKYRFAIRRKLIFVFKNEEENESE